MKPELSENITNEQLQDAFQVILNAFSQKTNSNLHSISAIEFIQEDVPSGDLPTNNAFRFDDDINLHRHITRKCVRINGHWVCRP